MSAKGVGPKFKRLEKGVSYDEAKLRELIVYVADKCERDRFFGAVKLNKILFYSDFIAYSTTGRPITGAEYSKQQFGPVATRSPSVKRALIKRRAVFEKDDPVPGGYEQKKLLALRQPVLSKFAAAEIAIVDRVIESLRDNSGADVSEMSHQYPGWKLAEMGEKIPYYTVFLPQTPIPLSKSDLEWARGVTERLRPVAA